MNNNFLKIGALGRHSTEKGFDILISAISLLKDMDIKLILGGEGVRTNHLKELTRSLNLDSKIEFKGWIYDKAEFFNDIDICIIPSLEESFGLVILESWHAKKPLIATPTKGIKEICRNHENAIICKDFSPEELAKNIIMLSKNKE